MTKTQFPEKNMRLEFPVFSRRHLPLQSLKDAEYVLNEIQSKNTILQFRQNGCTVQFSTEEKEGQVYFNYQNTHPSTDISNQISFTYTKDMAIKELHRLRKYFNQKYHWR